MNFWKRFFEEIKSKNMISDILNVALGIIMIILIILFVVFPGQGIILGLLFLVAGLMNLQTGISNMRNPKKKNTAMCFIMLGSVILILGALFLKKVLI